MSSATVTVTELDEASAWTAIVEAGPALPTHRHSAIAAAAQTLGGAGKLWSWRTDHGVALCAVIARPLASGGFDLVTPIGFSGLAYAGDPSGLSEAWTTDWRTRGAVAAYLQLHPFRSADQWQEVWHGVAPGLRTGPVTYVWDLTPSLEALEQGLARDHRLRLRKWWKQDTQTVVDGPALADRFAELYADFATRRAVGSAYQMRPEVLRAVADDEGVMAVGAGPRDEAVSAVSLFPYAGARADYYLNGAAPDGRHHARGLVWTAMTALKQRGVQSFNLGGGVRPGDSLDSFKRRFGAQPVETRVLCQVFDAHAYAKACAHRGVEPDDDSGYFPIYRKP